MLSVHQITHSYSIDPLLVEVSFNLKAGERLGLVGPNGCGKTTLLRILAGELAPQRGSVQFTPPDLRRAYLPQGADFASGETVGAFLTRVSGSVADLGAKVERLAEALAAAPADESLAAAYDRALAALTRSLEAEARATAVLAALGLDRLGLDQPARALSGGQKARLNLAGALLSAPQLLLLDEPSNHLDFEMLAWLEDWLLGFRGGVLMVSHDRALLDRTATGILEIDPRSGRLMAYPGNYSVYLGLKAAERERQAQEYSDQQVEIARLKAAARHYREIGRFHRGGKSDTDDKFARGFFANRGKGTIARARHIEARLERLTGEERLERPPRDWQLKMDFSAQAASRSVASAEGLAVGYGDRVVLAGLDFDIRHGDRIALIGPNGSGKSTLIKTLAGALPPLGGQLRLGAAIRPGYLAQEQESLPPGGNPVEILLGLGGFSETAARQFLSYYLFTGDEVFTPAASLSYGERARLNLACLVALGCNFLLLDEPFNHLDIPSRARFEQALERFGGTILAAAHDRYFIRAFASQIWQLSEGKLLRTALLEGELPDCVIQSGS